MTTIPFDMIEVNHFLIFADKVRFETPDNPAGGAEMQNAGSIEITNVSERFASRQTMSGLL